MNVAGSLRCVAAAAVAIAVVAVAAWPTAGARSGPSTTSTPATDGRSPPPRTRVASSADEAHAEPRDAAAVAPSTAGVPHDVVSELRARLRCASGDGLVAMRAALRDLSLADDVLVAGMEEHCGITADDVPRGVPVFEFASRVARIGVRGTEIEPEFHGDDFESEFPARIAFATAVDEGNAPVVAGSEFRHDVERIYATFATEPGIGRDVLVKWSHLDDETIYLYRKTPLQPRSETDYVWLRMPDGWNAGTWAVEVYSLRRNLAPIAGGRYVVR